MKVLFIGLGGIGQRHLRNLRQLRGRSLEVAAFRQRRLRAAISDRLQIEAEADVESRYEVEVFDDLRKALNQRPDAVFICNPTSMHVAAALEAARSNCALFIEKPISDRLTNLADLLDLARTRSLVTLVGYQMRFHPLLRKLKERILSRAIGRVAAVRAVVGEYLPGWHPYEDYRKMYASRRSLGGGVVLSQIHELDYLYWLFGPPRRIFAVGGHLSRLEIDVEDVASIQMEFGEEGRILPVHLQQDYLQRPANRRCEVTGDEGRLVLDLGEPRLTRYDAEGNVAEEDKPEGFERNQLFLDEMGHFLRCVEGAETPMVPLEEGVVSLRMALAARESISTGRVIEFEAAKRSMEEHAE